MIRVTLTLVPFGDESRARVIGEMEISNTTGVYSDNRSNYVVGVKVDETETPKDRIPRLFEIIGHKRSDGAWALLNHVLGTALARAGIR